MTDFTPIRTAEAAALLGITPGRLRVKKCLGDIPADCYREPPHSRPYYIKEKLLAWIDASGRKS